MGDSGEPSLAQCKVLLAMSSGYRLWVFGDMICVVLDNEHLEKAIQRSTARVLLRSGWVEEAPRDKNPRRWMGWSCYDLSKKGKSLAAVLSSFKEEKRNVA